MKNLKTFILLSLIIGSYACNVAFRTDRTNRPSEDDENVPGFDIIEVVERPLEPTSDLVIESGNTSITFDSQSVASISTVRLTRYKTSLPISANEAIVLDSPIGDTVKIEVLDRNSLEVVSEILKDFTYRQTQLSLSGSAGLAALTSNEKTNTASERDIVVRPKLKIDDGTGLRLTESTIKNVAFSMRRNARFINLYTIKVSSNDQAPSSSSTSASGSTTGGNDQPNEPLHLTNHIKASYRSTCVVNSILQVKCWGANSGAGNSAHLGSGDNLQRGDTSPSMNNLVPVNFGDGQSATSLALGSWSYSCAETADQQVKCWGVNSYTDFDSTTWSGWTGRGSTASHLGDSPSELGSNFNAIDFGSGRTVKAASASCAILDNNQVKCWGPNWGGSLGLGKTTAELPQIGDQASLMGDNWASVSLGTGVVPVQISSSGDTMSSCVVTSDQKLKCWGHNSASEASSGLSFGTHAGKLGLEHTNSMGDSPTEMGDSLPFVNLGTSAEVKQVSAEGVGHTCALINDGDVKCWGVNDEGQLGLGHANTLGDNANEMGDNLPLVNLGGRKAKVVKTGYYNTCVIETTGGVKCWGSNVGGILGLGNTNTYGDSAGEVPANLNAIDFGEASPAVELAIGRDHACVMFENGKLKCWGSNNSGQLGIGNTNNMGDNPSEMGSNLPEVIY